MEGTLLRLARIVGGIRRAPLHHELQMAVTVWTSKAQRRTAGHVLNELKGSDGDGWILMDTSVAVATRSGELSNVPRLRCGTLQPWLCRTWARVAWKLVLCFLHRASMCSHACSPLFQTRLIVVSCR